MEKNSLIYQSYLRVLKEELVPAMGCTEPIALAYAAAKCRETLGHLPDEVKIQLSGSIIKNVKSVIVPNTNQLKGIKAAVVSGIIAGKSNLNLEVISKINDDERLEILEYMNNCPVTVESIDDGHVFDIILTTYYKDEYSKVRIVDFHTNIVLVEKNGTLLYSKETIKEEEKRIDRSFMNMESIYDFVQSLDIQDVKEMLDLQIKYNMAIAEEGLTHQYGVNFGKLLLDTYGGDIKTKVKAYAAAGSDARMSGCEMPVIINSGSGNQGIACSVPVIVYAKELNLSDEKMYRALTLSNLVTIHEKNGIGTLSAYCGAISAGAASGAGIAYLEDANFEVITHTVSNALAIVSGIVCDGAKPSCAGKIASAIDAGITGYYMAKRGNDFRGGDGIVMKDIEGTILGIGKLSRDGMKQTNEEIIKLMMESES